MPHRYMKNNTSLRVVAGVVQTFLSDAFRLVNRGRGLVFQMIAANNILLIVARENLRVNCKRAIQA